MGQGYLDRVKNWIANGFTGTADTGTIEKFVESAEELEKIVEKKLSQAVANVGGVAASPEGIWGTGMPRMIYQGAFNNYIKSQGLDKYAPRITPTRGPKMGPGPVLENSGGTRASVQQSTTVSGSRGALAPPADDPFENRLR